MTKKKLPIGIQSFEKIRSDNFYYVDKSYFVKRLFDDGGGYYFLSRPRRFGKSLFLDTLRQAFLGKKGLFKGLFLEENWSWKDKYPVIYISFGSGVHKNTKELKSTIKIILDEHAENHKIALRYEFIKDRFMELIKRLCKKYDKRAVVLIDEYDKPILDNIEHRETALEIRDELKNLYSVLKDADAYLKFVFITGVSKFSKVSLFSGLNNLRDITIDPKYATICGYTQDELEAVFKDRLSGVELDNVRRWYNGYSWLGGPVYNPFDVLLFLESEIFRPYWFETGTPAFLLKLIEKKKYFVPELEEVEASEKLIGSFDIESIEVETLLFQTGYLTIKDVLSLGGRRTYLLKYPNFEVKLSFTDALLDYMVKNIGLKEKNIIKFYRLLQSNDLEGLKGLFHSFFASIPYDWYRKNELSGYEGYYASIFYCYFTALGLDVRVEDATNKGRLDMAVLFEDRCYIFEFKVVEFASKKSAMEQLREKKYYEKYKSKTKEIWLIGVEFSKKDRNIVSFDCQKYVF